MLHYVLTLLTAALLVTPEALAAMTVALTAKPDPPDTGANTVDVEVKDETGKPVDGAKLTFSIFMPTMGTMPRMDVTPIVESKGGGHYLASFDLPMGGTWEITVTVEKDGTKEISRHSITTGIPGITSKGGTRSGAAPAKAAAELLDVGPGRLQKFGVRFAEVKTVNMRRDVEAVGVVEQDQTHRNEVTLRVPGYVVKQLRGRVGDTVAAGDPLMTVYSPDLVAAQSEFLLADNVSSGGRSLHAAAADKLKNLGLSNGEIAQIRKRQQPLREITVRAKASGTILEVGSREGAAVSAGQVLYIIGDLSKSYIVTRVFQQDVGALKVGQPAAVAIPGGATKDLAGMVDLIYPQVEPGAGTANVRVVLKSASSELKPGIYVDVRFPVELGEHLAIPAEAVLYSGRHRYVFVDHGDGMLEPRAIAAGRSAGSLVEVLSGLKEGERVAASGTFLLGSEAQLRSALPKWTTGEAKDTP
jgi:Cu(I)/Ag(I) efflux system membrane fusion protein